LAANANVDLILIKFGTLRSDVYADDGGERPEIAGLLKSVVVRADRSGCGSTGSGPGPAIFLVAAVMAQSLSQCTLFSPKITVF
jgi:hypothetical protein